MADNNLGSMADLFGGYLETEIKKDIEEEKASNYSTFLYENVCDSVADFKRHTIELSDEVLKLYNAEVKTVMELINILQAIKDLEWEISNLKDDFSEYLKLTKVKEED